MVVNIGNGKILVISDQTMHCRAMRLHKVHHIITANRTILLSLLKGEI
jgi:hypothetical protein